MLRHKILLFFLRKSMGAPVRQRQPGLALESLKSICQEVVQQPERVGVTSSKANGQVLRPMLWDLVGYHLVDNQCVLLVGARDVGNGCYSKSLIATLAIASTVLHNKNCWPKRLLDVLMTLRQGPFGNA